MPHHSWSLHPGGMQGGMNLSRGVCATHRQRDSAAPHRGSKSPDRLRDFGP
jgi:hypothetical protein